jgi:DNA polymerase III subunit epsilon
MRQINQETFVCIDCETTGLDPKEDRIIEVAAARFTLKETLTQFESLIDPERTIPESSIVIHQITQDMVLNKPTIDKVLPELLELIGKHIIIGHGVGFDIELIANAADRAGIPHTLRSNSSLDTLRMARLYGESPTNSLEKLREHFNIPLEGAHRAMNDVIVNCDVFRFLAQRYKTIEQLFDVLSRPIKMKIMPLGKHKGRPLKEVPLQYLQWAVNKDFDNDLLYSIRSEIAVRKKGNHFSQSCNPFKELEKK